jgi:hypothetical protein
MADEIIKTVAVIGTGMSGLLVIHHLMQSKPKLAWQRLRGTTTLEASGYILIRRHLTNLDFRFIQLCTTIFGKVYSICTCIKHVFLHFHMFLIIASGWKLTEMVVQLLVSGRSWVRSMVGSNQRVYNMVSVKYAAIRSKNKYWFDIRIICLSGATCLPVDCFRLFGSISE